MGQPVCGSALRLTAVQDGVCGVQDCIESIWLSDPKTAPSSHIHTRPTSHPRKTQHRQLPRGYRAVPVKVKFGVDLNGVAGAEAAAVVDEGGRCVCINV